MKNITLSEKDAAKMLADIKAAPMLDLSQDRDFMVARIGCLPPWNRMTAHLETTEGARWRLPPELTAWAFDCVSLALNFHNPFPCHVRLGQDQNGHPWAEIDTEGFPPMIATVWQNAGGEIRPPPEFFRQPRRRP